ncbi:MAG: chemotaxis protein CheX [Lachnospiraceae bacterium]|jgi:chemotaxis protein CheX|nr:chemotaxis protein CheX [Lachnospiraceae bacterium]
MDNKIYMPFFEATKDVLKLMLDIEAESKAGENQDNIFDSENKLNISIGLTGDIKGEILYKFPKETTLEMAKIMSGMEFNEVDDFVTSAVGEIANIISGKALIALSEKEIQCDILSPKVIMDAKYNDTYSESHFSKVCTDIGEIEIDIYSDLSKCNNEEAVS